MAGKNVLALSSTANTKEYENTGGINVTAVLKEMRKPININSQEREQRNHHPESLTPPNPMAQGAKLSELEQGYKFPHVAKRNRKLEKPPWMFCRKTKCLRA